jgi:hypothetical protein
VSPARKPPLGKAGKKGRASRVKGRRGEQEVATILRESMPEVAADIRRGWQSRVGCDDPDVCGLPGFWIEVKTGKQPNIRAAYKQAFEAAKGRAFPLAVVQDDYARDRLCVVGLRDFLRILRAAYGYTDPLRYGVQLELTELAEPAQVAE